MNGVPQTARRIFHPRRAPYALIIGVYNEGTRFTRQLAALQPYRALVDIIIADGGSTDDATSSEALQDKVRALLINTDRQRGLSVQYRGAMHFALEEGYEGIVMMDGNGKDGPDAIPRFVEKLQAGFDFVQGSRFAPGGRHERTPPIRVLGIRLIFNPIMWLGSGFYYTDGMNGFKAVSRVLLTDARVQPLRSCFVRYNLQYYLNYIAPRLYFRVCEIPVARIYPDDGAPYSKINGLAGYSKIMLELLCAVVGKYNP